MMASDIVIDESTETVELWCRRLASFDANGEDLPDVIQLHAPSAGETSDAITVGEDLTFHDSEDSITTIDLHTGNTFSVPQQELWLVSDLSLPDLDTTAHFRSRPQQLTIEGAPIPPVTAAFHPAEQSPPTFLLTHTWMWESWFSGRIEHPLFDLDDDDYFIHKSGGLLLYTGGIPFAKLAPGTEPIGARAGTPPYFRLGHPAVSPKWTPDVPAQVYREEIPGTGDEEAPGTGPTQFEVTRLPAMADAEIRLYNQGKESVHLLSLENTDGSDFRASLLAGTGSDQTSGIEAYDESGKATLLAITGEDERSDRIAVGEFARSDDDPVNGSAIDEDGTLRAGYASDDGRGVLRYDSGTLTMGSGFGAGLVETVSIDDGFAGDTDDDFGSSMELRDGNGHIAIELTTDVSPPTFSVYDEDGRNTAAFGGDGSVTLGTNGVGGSCTVVGDDTDPVFSVDADGNVEIAGDFVRDEGQA